MKYYGPLDKHGEGRAKAARVMLGKLEARMRTTGQKFGVWKRQLENGSRLCVQINLNGISPTYRAWTNATQQGQQLVLDVFMESGFIDSVFGESEVFEPKVVYTEELLADLLAFLAGSSGFVSWLDWLTIDLKSTSRVYRANMPSLAFDTVEQRNDYVADSANSGKALLLWQALAGVKDIKRADYNGATISH